MIRSTIAISLVSVFLLAPQSLWAQTPDVQKHTSSLPRFHIPLPEFARSLGKPAKFKGFDDARMTFEAALEALSDQYEVTIIIDTNAFELAGIKDIRDQRVAKKPIPKIERATCVEALKAVLARLPEKAEPICLPRRDYLEITTLPMGVEELRRAGRTVLLRSKELGVQMTRSIFIPIEPIEALWLSAALGELVRTESVYQSWMEVVVEAATRPPPK